MPIFPSFPRRNPFRAPPAPVAAHVTPGGARRHFFNAPRFQCYASFFPLWNGWVSAGHCATDSHDLIPPFASGPLQSWPDGLDAALYGCALPARAPFPPAAGLRVTAAGFPAGSRHVETRHGRIYIQRSPGQWIVQLDDADEPVVTGMSGGPVLLAEGPRAGQPIGILITRNSPADLDADSDPDESYDFIALNAVWEAVSSRVA